LAQIKVNGDAPLDPAAPLTSSPAFYALKGRTQGFAAALGTGRITPEHVLLGLMWDPASRSSHLVWRLGASRERIVERLRDLGIPTPAAPLPRQREVEWGARVWFDRADVKRVVDRLRLHIPPGTRWGFNYDGSAKGVEWKLYEAACADEAGDLVDAKPKTFQDAEKLAGRLVEFEVERQDDERYGTSYLLDLPRRASNRGGGLKDSVDQLHARVKQLKPSSPSWLELGASQLTLRRDGSPRLPSRMSARDSPLPPGRTGAASDDRPSLPLPGGRMKGPPYALPPAELVEIAETVAARRYGAALLPPG
jgi:hypothetical protein